MDAADLTHDLVGREVFDAARQRLGRVDSLYRDTETATVAFAAVAMTRRGRRRLVYVSLVDASLDLESITLRCGEQLARRAPQARPGRSLPDDLEQDLYRHFELPYHQLGNGSTRLRLVP